MWKIFCLKEYKSQFRENPIKLLGLFLRDLKYCIQRCNKGFCDRDLRNIDLWFLEVMPEMLQQFKDTRKGSPGVLGENYINKEGILCNDACHAEWDQILKRMIFLLKEANERTCRKKNPQEAEYDRVIREFSRLYGDFGERVKTEEGEKTSCVAFHIPSEIPEYKEIEDKYYEEEKKLERYREQCKDQALKLFSKWFFYLWY